MCYFITVAIQARKGQTLVEAGCRVVRVDPYSSPSVERTLATPGLRLYALTTGGCSCSLYAEEPEGEPIEDEIRKLRRKYKRKGWSEAKIERAVEERRSRPPPKDAFVGFRPDVRELLAGVAEAAGELTVFVHFYDGGVETERFSLRRGPVVTPEMLRQGSPPIQPDEIVRVRRSLRRQT